MAPREAATETPMVVASKAFFNFELFFLTGASAGAERSTTSVGASGFLWA